MKNKLKKLLKPLLIVFVCLLIGGGVGISVDLAVRPTKEGDSILNTNFTIELSANHLSAILETSEGEVEIVEVPTVEMVDGEQPTACKDEECGLGAFIYAPTETPEAFKEYTLAQCFNTDGYYGGQCWDLGDMFWQNYAGRRLSTCGTGMAKGIWNCKEEVAGNEFELITDPTQLQAGDWLIFDAGTYGHIGMALGGYNNGYIALLGQNQGGTACDGGGSSTNIINISLSSFKGAFRPKAYIKQEPVSPLPISNCIIWGVERGDTMSKIMLECENTVVYGEAMNAYARTWFSLDVMPNQSVYDGWRSPSGVGLYAGDRIEHKF